MALSAAVNAGDTASAAALLVENGVESGIEGDEDNDVFAASHLASRFALFSGSRQNAQNLVTGLRYGSAIRLTANDPNSARAGLIFTPPTSPMMYGDISRALSVTQALLANYGVANPTPEQLHIALMGGSFTNDEKTIGTTGVLQLRTQGLGWGQIAQALSANIRSDAKSRADVIAQTHQDVTSMPPMHDGDFLSVAGAE